VGPTNARCGASTYLASTACDSDVSRRRIICSRINIYMEITEHSFGYIFTFPTAALVKWRYEWLRHLQPDIIHKHTQYSSKEILIRDRHTTSQFILQTRIHIAVQTITIYCQTHTTPTSSSCGHQTEFIHAKADGTSSKQTL